MGCSVSREVGAGVGSLVGRQEGALVGADVDADVGCSVGDNVNLARQLIATLLFLLEGQSLHDVSPAASWYLKYPHSVHFMAGSSGPPK